MIAFPSYVCCSVKHVTKCIDLLLLKFYCHKVISFSFCFCTLYVHLFIVGFALHIMLICVDTECNIYDNNDLD